MLVITCLCAAITLRRHLCAYLRTVCDLFTIRISYILHFESSLCIVVELLMLLQSGEYDTPYITSLQRKHPNYRNYQLCS